MCRKILQLCLTRIPLVAKNKEKQIEKLN